MKAHKLLILSVLALLLAGTLRAEPDPHGDEKFDFGKVLMHHVEDAYEWEFFAWKGKDGHHHKFSLPLPRILYSQAHGLELYGSTEALKASGKYELDHGVAHLKESHGNLLDLSITKAAFHIILISLFMLILFVRIARSYKKREGQAPKGVQSFFEPIILFIRDDIAKPSLGDVTDKYMPYLLSLFFFIWFSNMFGLMPFNSNIMGTFTVTTALAILTFILTTINGSKDYWMHIFNPPGVPMAIKPIVVIIEFMGLFIKPLALTLRLFANIIGGHFMILSLVGLIFVLGGNGEKPAIAYSSMLVAIIVPAVLMLLEFLVALLQAYIFTMLTALFIGLAREKHDHDHEGAHSH